jgi:4-hydroxybenzoate polyprenyltransferase
MWARTAKFLISTSLLLSIDGSLIVIFGCLLYNIPINLGLIIASFLAVFSVYNLNKATDKAEDSINRPGIVSKSTSFYVIPSVIAMIVSLVIGALNGVFAILILSTPIFIGLLYSVKISKNIPRFKEITGAKSISVALSWSLIGALLPLASGAINAEEVFLVFIYIFIQVMINTIIFDAFDVKGDATIGIKTIPVALGLSNTRRVLFLANTILIPWTIFCYFQGLFVQFLPALIFGIAYGYLILWRYLDSGHRSLASDLLIDGEWVFIVPLMRFLLR